MSCNHVYGPWTRWVYYGMQLDVRERYCRACPHTDHEQRAHVHDYRPPQPDVHAPVGSGLMIKACRGCSDTVRV